jgi:hypothetical protein
MLKTAQLEQWAPPGAYGGVCELDSWLASPGRHIINFTSAYDTPPTVAVGLSGLGIHPSANARLETQISRAPTTDSVEVKMEAWDDTDLTYAAFNWLEIAPDDPRHPSPYITSGSPSLRNG